MSEIPNNESLDLLLSEVISDSLDETQKREVEALKRGSDNLSLPASLIGDDSESLKSDELSSLMGDLTTPQKIKLALFGNKAARSALIRDASRQIPLFVLKNPRLSDDEIVDFAKNSNISGEVLRAIAGDSKWMKNYSVKIGIVTNSKTPLDIGLRWLKYIQERDLKKLAKSKEISSVMSVQCRKLLDKRRK